ncbi:MAG: SPW repeat protein [Caldilineaceae bacterium]
MYWLTGFLGFLMAVAPFALGYNTHSTAMWTAVVLGLIVLVASVFEAYDVRKAKWEYWVAGVAGIVAVIVPFVFGFTALTIALWTMVILGVVMFVLAGYEVFFMQEPV